MGWDVHDVYGQPLGFLSRNLKSIVCQFVCLFVLFRLFLCVFVSLLGHVSANILLRISACFKTKVGCHQDHKSHCSSKETVAWRWLWADWARVSRRLTSCDFFGPYSHWLLFKQLEVSINGGTQNG